MKWLVTLLAATTMAASCAAEKSRSNRLPAAAAVSKRPGLSSEQRSRLQSLLAELTREPFGTGAALALSIDGESHLFASGVQWTGGPNVTEQTRFSIASVSKLMTAAKVLDLAHRGTLSLTDTVGVRLPGVRLLDRSGSDRSSEVTIEQLLEHTGGLPHQPSSLDPAAIGASWTDPDFLAKLTASWDLALTTEPGHYAYSNVGYALLGAIVERVEGVPFADAMQGLLTATGMAHATYVPAQDATNVARGRVVREGAVVFLEPDWYGSRYGLPFTGLFASMPDMMRFGQALLAAHGDSSSALNAMTHHRGKSGHGLGPVFRERFGLRSLEHDGAGPGFMAWLLVVPERNLVLAIACNGDGEDREKARRLFDLTDRMLAVVWGHSEREAGDGRR